MTVKNAASALGETVRYSFCSTSKSMRRICGENCNPFSFLP